MPLILKEHRQNPLELFEQGLQWVNDHWQAMLIAAGVGLLIYLALGLLKRLVLRAFRRGAALSGVMAVMAAAAERTSHVFMLLVAIRLVLGYANPPDVIFRTVQFIFIIVAAWQVAIWIRQIAIGFVQLRSDPELGGNETLANASGLIRALVTVAVFAIAAVVVLDNLGVNVTALVAGLGIGGIAIGLAAQGIFSDLFASLSIIFDKPFKVGDPINFGTQTAVVEKIGLKSTRLRVVTGERLIVSNAQLLNKEITSYARLNRRRIRFAIGVIYQTEPQRAAGIPAMMRSIVEEQGAEFVRAGFIGFGASSLDFEVEFDIMSGDWDEVYEARHRIGMAILACFNASGLEFAYPTQTTFTAAPDGRMIMPYPQEWAGGAISVAPVQPTSE